jgi:hypothetical protein
MMRGSTEIDMPESSSVSKGTAPLIAAPMKEREDTRRESPYSTSF